MNSGEGTGYHHDTELFRSALLFTQAETGFNDRLVEKDYYCSLLLNDVLSADIPGLAFKGGTSLSKIHADFCRLSEDLDFGISTPVDARRRDRSDRLATLKKHLAAIHSRAACFQVTDPLRGYNNSTQYSGRISYASLASGYDEHIKIEISVREPIIEAIEMRPARTLLLDPFRRAPAVKPIPVAVLSRREAYAEKLRAALSRRDPAVRDLFDIDHAYRTKRIHTSDRKLTELLRAKLSIPGNEPVDLSAERRKIFGRQVDAKLKPVLRDADFASFNIDRAWKAIREFAQLIEG